MRTLNRSASQGFTLIELMVALVIVGILAGIAYPAYTKHVQRSRRADAIAALTVIMQAQERYRSNVSNYASLVSDLPQVDIAAITPHYTVSLAGVGATPGFTIGYSATATPVAGGKQAADATCKTFTVTVVGATPTYSATGDPNGVGTDINTSSLCWPR